MFLYAEIVLPLALDPFSYPPPSPLLAQTRSLPFEAALPLEAALHLPHAAEYSIPFPSSLYSGNLHLWPYDDALALQSHPSPLTVGLGISNLSQPASSCPCVGLSGFICAHQLHSEVAWVSRSRTALLAPLSSRLL